MLVAFRDDELNAQPLPPTHTTTSSVSGNQQRSCDSALNVKEPKPPQHLEIMCLNFMAIRKDFSYKNQACNKMKRSSSSVLAKSQDFSEGNRW